MEITNNYICLACGIPVSFYDMGTRYSKCFNPKLFWKCYQCDIIYGNNVMKCTRCDYQRTEITTWLCTRCTLINPDHKLFCDVCEKNKYESESMTIEQQAHTTMGGTFIKTKNYIFFAYPEIHSNYKPGLYYVSLDSNNLDTIWRYLKLNNNQNLKKIKHILSSCIELHDIVMIICGYYISYTPLIQ
jgi:hypothetical protein